MLHSLSEGRMPSSSLHLGASKDTSPSWPQALQNPQKASDGLFSLNHLVLQVVGAGINSRSQVMNELGSRIIHEVQQQGVCVCIHISLCLFFLLQHSQESQESVACASPSARLHAQSRSRKEMASHIHTRRNREDRDGSSTPRLLWCGELHRLQASRRTQSTIRSESVSASSLLSLVVLLARWIASSAGSGEWYLKLSIFPVLSSS